MNIYTLIMFYDSIYDAMYISMNIMKGKNYIIYIINFGIIVRLDNVMMHCAYWPVYTLYIGDGYVT